MVGNKLPIQRGYKCNAVAAAVVIHAQGGKETKQAEQLCRSLRILKVLMKFAGSRSNGLTFACFNRLPIWITMFIQPNKNLPIPRLGILFVVHLTSPLAGRMREAFVLV
jgi:hypothetical protein